MQLGGAGVEVMMAAAFSTGMSVRRRRWASHRERYGIPPKRSSII